MTDYINYIRREYGIYINFNIIQDPCALPDYMTVKITASTAKYGGGKEVNYKFQTTTISEQYLKKKIMEVVETLLKEDNKQDLIVARGTTKSMCALLSIDCRRQIEKVIFNNPATIVLWKDGTKTVVKCQPDDKFDKMTGLAMACSKYMLGNKGNYYDIFKKWIGDDNEI